MLDEGLMRLRIRIGKMSRIAAGYRKEFLTTIPTGKAFFEGIRRGFWWIPLDSGPSQIILEGWSRIESSRD